MSIRTEKVASVIKRSIARHISELAMGNSAGLATVTTVRLSDDLQTARIYISIYGGTKTPGEFITILEMHRGEIRHIIGKSIKLRSTPDIKFFIDDTLDQIDHIQKLLNSVKEVKAD
ncbi:MAG: 30S ribosome-binding factor RbfA [Candidatus Kapabacteria bacterium]|nr:30S ribosome-binding factor RbfA [Candidatus Kapabacteria bacterium]